MRKRKTNHATFPFRIYAISPFVATVASSGTRPETVLDIDAKKKKSSPAPVFASMQVSSNLFRICPATCFASVRSTIRRLKQEVA